MDIICVGGLPGVGKLTVARHLAVTSTVKLLHVHMILDTVMDLFPFTSAQAATAKAAHLKILLDLLSQTTECTVLTHGFDVFWNPAFEAIVDQHCDRTGDRRYYVGLHCDAREHLRRLASPERRTFKKIESVGTLQRLIDAGEFAIPPPEFFDLYIDTTEMNPHAIALRIASELPIPSLAVSEDVVDTSNPLNEIELRSSTKEFEHLLGDLYFRLEERDIASGVG